MPVSSWLQSHFDKKRKKKQVAIKLENIRGQIDPSFIASFEKFRSKVLCIVEDSPESCNIVEQEIDSLETKLERVKKKKKVKKFHTITDSI